MVAPVTPVVHRFPDLERAARALAARVGSSASPVLSKGGRFAIGLSGGSTPKPLFRSLATEFRSAAPWERADYFWADERSVGPEDPLSNFRLANSEWLAPVGVPAERIHRIRGEARPLEGAASAYERELRAFRPGDDGSTAPLLDLALLGIGPDGHTASLFPGSEFLEGTASWVGVVDRAGQPPYLPRITMTRAALNRSRTVLFLVAGAEKRPVLERILTPRPSGPAPPAAQIRGLESTEWYVDRDALG